MWSNGIVGGAFNNLWRNGTIKEVLSTCIHKIFWLEMLPSKIPMKACVDCTCVCIWTVDGGVDKSDQHIIFDYFLFKLGVQ